MYTRLKHVNRRTKRLASGQVVTYYYAWKGGPRLAGSPGSPEFVLSYKEAYDSRKKPVAGVLFSLTSGYRASDDFLSLAERTRSDYAKQLVAIDAAFGDMPLGLLDDRRTRAEFMAWRDKLALRSRRQADYAWTVLARVLSWAKNRGITNANPCEKGGRLYRGSRAEKIWTDDDEAAFLASAPAHLHLPLILALWTGQRQGDLLRLTWAAYDGRVIRLKQQKTGARVVIPVGAPLKAALDRASPSKRSPTILLTTDNKPWSSDGFRSSWRKAQAASGVVGVTFNDTRGTAVTRLAVAGATEAEIATLTGHALRDVRSILDAHYLSRDPALAESAVRKMEGRAKSGTRTPDRTPD